MDPVTTRTTKVPIATEAQASDPPSLVTWWKVAELDDLPAGRVRTVIAGRRSVVLDPRG